MFGDEAGAGRETVEAFGLETGLPIVRRSFGWIERRDHPDVLRCTDPVDVMAFLTSYPPGETATSEQRHRLEMVVRDRMAEGGGALVVHTEAGVLICRDPRPAAGTPGSGPDTAENPAS